MGPIAHHCRENEITLMPYVIIVLFDIDKDSIEITTTVSSLMVYAVTNTTVVWRV